MTKRVRIKRGGGLPPPEGPDIELCKGAIEGEYFTIDKEALNEVMRDSTSGARVTMAVDDIDPEILRHALWGSNSTVSAFGALGAAIGGLGRSVGNAIANGNSHNDDVTALDYERALRNIRTTGPRTGRYSAENRTRVDIERRPYDRTFSVQVDMPRMGFVLTDDTTTYSLRRSNDPGEIRDRVSRMLYRIIEEEVIPEILSQITRSIDGSR